MFSTIMANFKLERGIAALFHIQKSIKIFDYKMLIKARVKEILISDKLMMKSSYT